jgi:centromere protein C
MLARKTGKAIQQIARDSDEFEPFDQILSQADSLTPKGKARRKSSAKRRLPPVHEQEDGSADMDVDEEGMVGMSSLQGDDINLL